MKPKARQIVFLEYEQSGCESPPGIATVGPVSGKFYIITQVDDAICH
jgi:hypothetical protein